MGKNMYDIVEDYLEDVNMHIQQVAVELDYCGVPESEMDFRSLEEISTWLFWIVYYELSTPLEQCLSSKLALLLSCFPDLIAMPKQCRTYILEGFLKIWCNSFEDSSKLIWEDTDNIEEWIVLVNLDNQACENLRDP